LGGSESARAKAPGRSGSLQAYLQVDAKLVWADRLQSGVFILAGAQSNSAEKLPVNSW